MFVVDEVLDPDERRVRFRCPLGSGAGTWRGRSSPVAGAEDDVELEVVAEEIESVGLRPRSSPPSIRQLGSATVLVGTVEAVDAAGLIDFRMGISLLTLERTGALAGAREGDVLEIRAGLIELYPTGR